MGCLGRAALVGLIVVILACVMVVWQQVDPGVGPVTGDQLTETYGTDVLNAQLTQMATQATEVPNGEH